MNATFSTSWFVFSSSTLHNFLFAIGMTDPHLDLNPDFLTQNSDSDANPDPNGVTHVYPQCFTSKQKDKDYPDLTMTQGRTTSVNGHWPSRPAFNLYYIDMDWGPAHRVSENHVHMVQWNIFDFATSRWLMRKTSPLFREGRKLRKWKHSSPQKIMQWWRSQIVWVYCAVGKYSPWSGNGEEGVNDFENCTLNRGV